MAVVVWFFHLVLLSQLWVFQFHTGEAQGPPYVPETINIGALLTFDSAIGRVAKIAIEEAVNDVNSDQFILANTGLTLNIQNTNCTGFPAMVEVLQILQKDVVAIIGPQSSVLASMASNVANEIRVPLLSFSATDPTLSSLQFPYFVRMVQSDLYQMAAVVEIIIYFGWKQVNVLYVDDTYGRNGMLALGDKLNKNHCRISYKFGFQPEATEEDINDILKKIAALESRILVVHVSVRIGFQVFSKANDLGLMENGYVWIATDWLASVIDSSNPPPTDMINKMEGVLALRKYTPSSSRKTEFISRWNKVTKGSLGMNTYGLYAYDSVWVVALALEAMLKDNIFDDQSLLLQNIQESDFEGLTGLIKFSLDGSLPNPAYDVLNIVQPGFRQVGYWSNYSGLSVNPPNYSPSSSGAPNDPSTSEQRLLRTIIWPGDTSSLPQGWASVENSGKQLRVGIPNRVSFPHFVSLDKETGVVEGLCIDVFKAAIDLLPYLLTYRFIPFGDGQRNPSYTQLVNKIVTGDFDAVVGDIAIIKNRTKVVEMTLPYASSGLVVVAPLKEMRLDLWAFLHPFTAGLWIVSICFFIVVGVTVWILEHRVNDEFRGTLGEQAVTILSFSLSTMFFAHKENTISTLGRFVVIIWLFVVFIINSNYTASLTSFLTIRPFYSDIKGIDTLLASNDPIGYNLGSFSGMYLSDTLNISRTRLVPLGSLEEYATALTLGPKMGGVAAIVDEQPYIQVFLKNHCTKFGIVGLEFTSSGWGFAFPKDSSLAEDVSTAILELAENGELQRIYDMWLGKTGCSLEDEVTASDQMGLENFKGLYLIFGCILVIAFLVHMVRTCWRLAHSEGRANNPRKMPRLLPHFQDKGKRVKVAADTEMDNISEASTSTEASSHQLLTINKYS